MRAAARRRAPECIRSAPACGLGVVEAGDEIARLVEDRRAGGAQQREADLLGDRLEARAAAPKQRSDRSWFIGALTAPRGLQDAGADRIDGQVEAAPDEDGGDCRSRSPRDRRSCCHARDGRRHSTGTVANCARVRQIHRPLALECGARHRRAARGSAASARLVVRRRVAVRRMLINSTGVPASPRS